MRFGLDVAQQRMPWDELVRRAQLAEELGFDGVWGFDHFQPMYGEGPGETFEGMTTLAALAGLVFAARLNTATPKAGLGFELDESVLERRDNHEVDEPECDRDDRKQREAEPRTDRAKGAHGSRKR